MNYGENQIKVLKGLEAVRKRPGMYIGDTNFNGLHHMVYEVVDNSIDEAMAGYCNKITVELTQQGSCKVTDNGRGIPTGIHPTEKIPTLTVVLTVLHAGGKFDKDTYKTSGGLHGVGVSVVNALSSNLVATVIRDGNKYTQTFSEGKPTSDMMVEPIRSNTTGTTIEFIPDTTIFEVNTFDFSVLAKRFKELAYLNPGITIELIDSRKDKLVKEQFYFEGGVASFVSDINKKETVTKVISFKKEQENIAVDIALLYNVSYNDEVLSFVNNIRTPEGGTHEAGFRQGLSRAILTYKDKNITGRDKDIKLTGDDVREGLVAVVSVKIPEPQFEGQTKSKLGSSYVRGEVASLTYEILSKYFEENPNDARNIVNKAILAARTRDAVKRAKDLTRKKDNISSGTLPGKLADCSEKDPSVCEIFLVEGDSAGGSAKTGRIRSTQAILPLKGKILNVEKATLDKILKSEEIKNMITAFGCGIGDNFDIEKLRYHKIIIMTDADVDGSHIQTLLLTFFYRFMPEIINQGYLYIAQPPLFRYARGNDIKYFKDMKELNNYVIESGLITYNETLKLNQEQFNIVLKYLRKYSEFKQCLEDLSKQYSVIEAIEFIVNKEYKTISDLINVLSKYLQDVLKYNILNTVTTDNSFTLYIQTKRGLEKITIDNNLFNNLLFVYCCNLYQELKVLDYEYTKCKINGSIDFLFNTVVELGSKKANIQRYKGLGEMNPEQLWETAMNPLTRTLLRVTVNDPEEADMNFKLFMGDEVEPRREYIELHAKDVRSLDI